MMSDLIKSFNFENAFLYSSSLRLTFEFILDISP